MYFYYYVCLCMHLPLSSVQLHSMVHPEWKEKCEKSTKKKRDCATKKFRIEIESKKICMTVASFCPASLFPLSPSPNAFIASWLLSLLLHKYHWSGFQCCFPCCCYFYLTVSFGRKKNFMKENRNTVDLERIYDGFDSWADEPIKAEINGIQIWGFSIWKCCRYSCSIYTIIT